jgi:hypothetical protein
MGSNPDRVKPKVKSKTIKLVFVASVHAALMRKSKDCLVQNQNNVSVWNDNVYQWTVVSVN